MSKLGRWILESLVRPLVVRVGAAVEKTYNFFFWERDVRSSIERENQLASEIRQNLPFLFSDQGAIVPIESIQEHVPKSLQHPRPFDYAVVIVAIEDLLLRFIRGRGEFNIQVTRKCDPNGWGELPLVLHWLGWREQLGGPRSLMSLQDVAEVLGPRMDLLRDAYSDTRYPNTKQMVLAARDHEQGVARQLSAELNRKLYG